jgi:splicing factor 3B subunit 2
MPSAVAMATKMTKNQMRRAKKKEQKKSQVSAADEVSLNM